VSAPRADDAPPSRWGKPLLRAAATAAALAGLSLVGLLAGPRLSPQPASAATSPAPTSLAAPMAQTALAAAASSANAAASSPAVAAPGAPAASGSAQPGGEGAPAPPSGTLADGRVVLNLAGEDDLRKLPGVGATRARAILALRQRLGRFRRVSDLLKVKGIGRKSLARLAPRLVLDPPAPPPQAPP
jgi:competence protein ComEA